MSTPRLVAIIGGTGAQGVPVVRELLKSGDYAVRVLTRDTDSARFKELQSYGPVESVVGTFASEESLRATFRGAWGAWVNIDGFNSGEKAEIFWTIRGEWFFLSSIYWPIRAVMAEVYASLIHGPHALDLTRMMLTISQLVYSSHSSQISQHTAQRIPETASYISI